MNNELTKELVNACPSLYIKGMGFQCSDGWFDLVKELSLKLEKVINKLPGRDNYYAVQVKEKFGTLRVYLSSVTNEINDIIYEYEEKSASICEECGQPGEPRETRNHWYYTACNKCHNLRK
jgi:ribosomal protein L37AE/L43A